MPDPRNIPYLVKLLDDDSEDVQETIVKELSSFGEQLKEEIKKYNLELNSSQQRFVRRILSQVKQKHLKNDWSSWFAQQDPYLKLERAIELVSIYLNEMDLCIPLKVMLDDLAVQYKERFIFNDARLLAKFLFREKGLKGSAQDYYNPQNSNLFSVLSQRQGIPISLTAVFMLVGQRLGLNIEGCNFPGHFLARVDVKGKIVFVDCFSSGQFFEAKEVLKLRKESGEGLETILYEDMEVETIVRRYLVNLIRAFEIKSKMIELKNEKDYYVVQAKFMVMLLKELDAYHADQQMATIHPNDIIKEKPSIFKPGYIVRHRKYGYRGLVVDIDLSCKASDDWYYTSAIQPNRYQPWVHILVDGTDQVTYVGESEIIPDKSAAQFSHPLLAYFFTTTKGKYVRNDNPWPATDF